MFIADEVTLQSFGDAVKFVLEVAALVLVVGLLILVVIAMPAYEAEEKRKRDEAAGLREAARNKAAATRQAELETQHKQRQRELEDQARVALDKAIVQAREAADERFQRTITTDSVEGLDAKMRELHMIQNHMGKVLTVRVYLVPTGWLTIEWMLDPRLPTPLKVICVRDRINEVFSEYAYKGVWTNLLDRGREFAFSFRAMEGRSDREDGLQFTVTIPTKAQWERKVNPTPPPEVPEVDEATKRQETINQKLKLFNMEEQAWEHGRQAGYQQIDVSAASDIEKRHRKARLDAQIAKERDEPIG